MSTQKRRTAGGGRGGVQYGGSSRMLRTKSIGVDINGHHRRATGCFTGVVVLLVLIALGVIVVIALDITAVTQHHKHHPHQYLEPKEACADGNQCTVDAGMKIGNDLACFHPPSPHGTECNSVCYEGSDHGCNADGECVGDTCLGYCDDDSDCPDIDFTTGVIWSIADSISNGAFGFDKFCYRHMCIYEHDSAVLPLTASTVEECTSAPAALAFADGLIDVEDPLASCLVPSAMCRGHFDDQVRVDSILHTFACSNASLPLLQFAGNTP